MVHLFKTSWKYLIKIKWMAHLTASAFECFSESQWLKAKLSSFISVKGRGGAEKWNNESLCGVRYLTFKFFGSVWDILVYGKSPWWCSYGNEVNLYSALKGSERQKACAFAASKTGEPFKRIINRDNLFDMFCQGKLLWGKKNTSVKIFEMKYWLISI